jgi:hypothetical protein
MKITLLKKDKKYISEIIEIVLFIGIVIIFMLDTFFKSGEIFFLILLVMTIMIFSLYLLFIRIGFKKAIKEKNLKERRMSVGSKFVFSSGAILINFCLFIAIINTGILPLVKILTNFLMIFIINGLMIHSIIIIPTNPIINENIDDRDVFIPGTIVNIKGIGRNYARRLSRLGINEEEQFFMLSIKDLKEISKKTGIAGK